MAVAKTELRDEDQAEAIEGCLAVSFHVKPSVKPPLFDPACLKPNATVTQPSRTVTRGVAVMGSVRKTALVKGSIGVSRLSR
jgi:hypothetical protein